MYMYIPYDCFDDGSAHHADAENCTPRHYDIQPTTVHTSTGYNSAVDTTQITLAWLLSI